MRNLSVPRNLTVLNAILILIILLLNCYYQAFCVPTNWTIVLLAVCFINTTFYPYFSRHRLLVPVASFINGISFFVFVYCIIFLEQMYIWGLMFSIILIGGVVFIPLFLALQLVWTNLVKPVSSIARYSFLLAFPVCIGIVISIGIQYRNAIKSIKKFEQSNYQQLDKNFMTEKILGMHFIYHTRFCEFDGWRPPKHEPILVIGMWLNDREDPLKVDLKKRLELYKKFFPDHQYKFDCSCAYQYREDYFNDRLFN